MMSTLWAFGLSLMCIIQYDTIQKILLIMFDFIECVATISSRLRSIYLALLLAILSLVLSVLSDQFQMDDEDSPFKIIKPSKDCAVNTYIVKYATFWTLCHLYCLNGVARWVGSGENKIAFIKISCKSFLLFVHWLVVVIFFDYYKSRTTIDLSGHSFCLCFFTLALLEDVTTDAVFWMALRTSLDEERQVRLGLSVQVTPLAGLTLEQFNYLTDLTEMMEPYFKVSLFSSLFLQLTFFGMYWATLVFYHTPYEKWIGTGVGIISWALVYHLEIPCLHKTVPDHNFVNV